MSSGTLAARRRSPPLGPRLGQVEPAVDQRVPPAAAVGQEHADLAVLDLAQGAAVLPRHPGRVPALLGEAGLVDDQHRILGAQAPDRVLAAQVAGRLLVPEHVAEHPLRAPGPGVADRLRELPAVLALDRPEQPLQVAPRLLARLGAHEQPAEPGQQRVQLRPPAAHLQRHCHARLLAREAELTPTAQAASTVGLETRGSGAGVPPPPSLPVRARVIGTPAPPWRPFRPTRESSDMASTEPGVDVTASPAPARDASGALAPPSAAGPPPVHV